MTRVETAQDPEDVKKEIRKQVEVDIHKEAKRRKMFRCCSCLVIFLILGGGVAFLAAWGVAKTGIYDIPFISSWAFHVPEPVHEVRLEEDYRKFDFLESMRSDINNLMETEYPGKLQASSASVSLPESAITAFILQNIIPLAEQSGFTVEKAQVAVETAGMELYGHIKRGDKSFYITINAVPEVVENDIRLNVTSAKFGDLKVPVWIADAIFGTFLDSVLKALKLPLIGFVNLERMDLVREKIVLYGTIEYTTFKK
ncbi:MAG: hypothetical protein PHW53_00390 [Patescibacteria group bacterium]|nr:hypothetical protein [Patescibacteria group bacterium]